MRRIATFVVLFSISVAARGSDFTTLRDAYLEKFKPLWLEAAATWWEANITGSDAAFARKSAADKAMVELHSDKQVFAKLKELKDGGKVTDPLEARELDVMYRSFLAGQADKALQDKIVDLENQVDQTFNTHRSKVSGKELTENDVREILGKSTNSAECEAAWKGYMEVGAKVDGKLRELVKLRNQLAVQLGYKDFFEKQLALQEIDAKELLALLDSLDGMVRPLFTDAKAEIDQARAAKFGLKPGELRPWHFGDLFFQEAPAGKEVDFDELFKNTDLLAVTKQYYNSMGLPCDDILAHSDLYEKPGKNPHAFCSDLNRVGDIRVLCNIKPNLYWADTVVHESGHGVYAKYIRADVPFMLHEESHGLTTEGMAMLFGALVQHEEFLNQLVKVPPAMATKAAAEGKAAIRAHRLLFAQWAQVMVRFEQGMYSNPDQDLGKLWWDLKKKYQLLNPPETTNRPDYAAKIHILSNPVYYQSYLMGELFAAQVRNYAAVKVLGLPDAGATSFYNQPKAGAYFKDKIFGPGNTLSWNELTKSATGEALSPKYFVQQLK